MESFLAMLLCIFIFVAIIAFRKWHELSLQQELKNLVVWSAICDHPFRAVSGHDLPLWSYISNAQIEFQLPQDYRITGDDEWCFAKEILEEYQTNLIRSYLIGNLKLIKSKYAIRGEDYFMLMLYAFLSDHQCDDKFLNHEMHKERVSYKSYGSTFSAGFDATYALTDFAVVLHKMHYITYMYCIENKVLKPFVPEWNEKNLKKILDTNQIQLSWG